MKKNKILLIVSLLAMMFAFAGCTEEKKETFDYDKQELAISTMELFDTYVDVPVDMEKYFLNSGTDLEKSAVQGISQARNNDHIETFEDFTPYVDKQVEVNLDDVTFEEGENYVTVTVINHAERDVEVSVKYEENDEYYIEKARLQADMDLDAYIENIIFSMQQMGSEISEEEIYATLEAQGLNILDLYDEEIENQLSWKELKPYKPVEMVVNVVYGNKELVKQAGMNTLIGMGTVFIVLIFISFIISMMKFLPALLAKKPKLPEEKAVATGKAPVPAPAAAVPSAPAEPMADQALVAVITAAIYASMESTSGATCASKDRLVVRSIKRVK